MTPESLRTWMSAAGGRRFLMCMGAHGINTTLFVLGTLSEQGYLTTFAGTVGAYMLAAGVQKYTETKNSA